MIGLGRARGVRGRPARWAIAAQLVFLAALLAGALVLHLSGSTLLIVKVARDVLVVVALLVLGRLRARRSPSPPKT